MTDHDEIATLHQEAVQQRARIKRLTAALRQIADPDSPLEVNTLLEARKTATAAIQEAGQ